MSGRQPSRRLAARVAIAVAVAVAGLLLVLRASPGSSTAQGIDTHSGSWQLPRLGGSGQLSLASLRGHPVVANFFASWCTACQGELPGMATVSNQLRGTVTFVGIDSEENGDGLAMARRYGIDWWPLAIDSGGSQASGLHDDLGAPGMPVTAFYDSGGRLLAVVPGAISETDLRARLRSLFGVTGPSQG